MSLRQKNVSALALALASVYEAPVDRAAVAGPQSFQRYGGPNAALFPRAKGFVKPKARVGQVDLRIDPSSLSRALKNAGRVAAPRPALDIDPGVVQHLIAKHQAKAVVPVNIVFSAPSANNIADDGTTGTITFTNTQGDATLLSFVVAEDMDGWNLTSFIIGSLGYNMIAGETAARVFAANAPHMLQLGTRVLSRNDTFSYVAVNRTGGAGLFTLSFGARLLNPPCVDD